MNQLLKLQYISLCSRVLQELENHTGVKDKVLAEFIIELGSQSKDEKEFKQKLDSVDADFTDQFTNSLFNIIKKMLPQNKVSIPIPQVVVEPKIEKFPGLALPNRDPVSRSRSKSKTPKKHKKKKREEPKTHAEIERGHIYEGIVTKVQDFGVFVQLAGFKGRKEGLVHISNIREKRVTNPFDILKRNQKVFVKVISIVGDKIGLSMRDVDQGSGIEIEKKAKAINEYDQVLKQQEQSKDNKVFGQITGVKLDLPQEAQKKKAKRIASPDLWELSRLHYNSNLVRKFDDQAFQQESESEGFVSDSEDLEIDMNDYEPPFLKGQTTKAGINLSPIRVVKNPEGTLQREALNAQQFARERREMREQQQRAINEQMRDKYREDPLAQAQGNPNQIQMEIPEWKKEAMFKSSARNRTHMSIKEWRESLPIYNFKEDLLGAIKENRILIVIGETGSGKTTQITQYLMEAGYGRNGMKIGCTQPRRVAAMSVAKRVSEEMGVQLGDEVGYAIRFEDCTGPNTIIKYMTDGMLLREALIDKDMSQYSVIMLDEAHERTINTDVLFGLLKQVVAKRNDFTLIVTSATLDAEKFSSYFFNCKIFRIPGRNFPVEVFFTKEPEEDYLEAALLCVMQIHLDEPAGDILLFLTGQEEIDTACQILHERMKKLGPEAPELIILPVYSALPTELQQKIFEQAPIGARKIVIATNIAEASITIDGIYYVVDPGFSKIKVYNPKLGMDSLIIAPISQASAQQRAGRAGRTGPGKCYRLYTESAFNSEMLPTSVPEIQRTNLANTILLLKAMGIHDLLNFDFMDPPPVQTMIAAMEQLYALGALDDEGLLTKVGRKMAEFPLEPPQAKMLLTAVDLSCVDEIITIIAMLSEPNIFYRPKDRQQIADQKKARFHRPEGDHLTLLTVYDAWKKNNFSNVWCHENYIQARSMRRAQDVRKQLLQIMERYKFSITSCQKDYWKIRKAITAGYFFHVAKKDPAEGYRTLADNHQVYIHPSSALFNKGPLWCVYHELVMTSKEYMREVCEIEPKWLIEVASNYFKAHNQMGHLSKKKKAEKLEPLQCKYGDPNAWRLSKRKG